MWKRLRLHVRVGGGSRGRIGACVEVWMRGGWRKGRLGLDAPVLSETLAALLCQLDVPFTCLAQSGDLVRGRGFGKEGLIGSHVSEKTARVKEKRAVDVCGVREGRCIP